ncbi:hypothetical protein MMC25_003072 [Agyrium rufum]|nr:hypothetical protein [Agyrium rufum]
MAFYRAPLPSSRRPQLRESATQTALPSQYILPPSTSAHDDSVQLDFNTIHFGSQTAPTISTEDTTQGAIRSKLSDFGSFNTVPRSDEYAEDGGSIVLDEEVDEDAELDSLDDGLQAFQEPHSHAFAKRFDYSGGAILPAHDGLGSFAASSTQIQEQLWSFESKNPQRRSGLNQRRRRSSVQRLLDEPNDDDEAAQVEMTRMERIEQWRTQQARILHEELQKEVMRQQSLSGSSLRTPREESYEKDGSQIETHLNASNNTWTDTDTEALNGLRRIQSESLWQRVSRHFVRDLLGIDDALLSLIYGETFFEEIRATSIPPASTATTTRLASNADIIPDLQLKKNLSDTWEKNLLERLAHELEAFLREVSGLTCALSNSSDTGKATMDYAGIPIEHLKTVHESPSSDILSTELQDPSSLPPFNPTLDSHRTNLAATKADSEHAAKWGIEDLQSATTSTVAYWEDTPDLKTVLAYLSNRFTTTTPTPSAIPRPLTTTQPTNLISNSTNVATSSHPESLRRAAIIRQHHPLISPRHHRQTANTRDWERRRAARHLRQYVSPLISPVLKRPSSSCASLSTRKSRRLESESSRNYWDLGGSGVGSGDAGGIAGVGFWGEV